MPTTPYDVAVWSTPKVARDQLASVSKATYSLPHPYVGQVVTARADTQTVRFYLRGLVIKMHARQPPGGQSIDASDYPVERSIYARSTSFNEAALDRERKRGVTSEAMVSIRLQ